MRCARRKHPTCHHWAGCVVLCTDFQLPRMLVRLQYLLVEYTIGPGTPSPNISRVYHHFRTASFHGRACYASFALVELSHSSSLLRSRPGIGILNPETPSKHQYLRSSRMLASRLCLDLWTAGRWFNDFVYLSATGDRKAHIFVADNTWVLQVLHQPKQARSTLLYTSIERVDKLMTNISVVCLQLFQQELHCCLGG